MKSLVYKVMTKKLLICPTCAEHGKKQVLGEFDEDGNLEVMRFKGQGEKSVTKISSPIMTVECGSCGEIVFYRKRNNV